MDPRRGFRLDLIATVLLAAGLLVTLCVLSQEPSGPGGVHTYPTETLPSNFFGPLGGQLAQELLGALGVAVYVLLASWFVLVILLFLRRSWLTWGLRLLGWLILLPCAAVLADVVGSEWLGGPLWGSGGAVGAWLNHYLEQRFEPFGRTLLLGGSIFMGLMLTADFVLLRLFRGFWLLAGAGLRFTGEASRFSWTGVRRVIRGFGTLRPRQKIRLPVKEEHSERPFPPEAEESVETADEPVIRHMDEALHLDDAPHFHDFELPPLTLLEDPKPFPQQDHDVRLRERAALLEKTFGDFGINVKVAGINTGPVITQYELALETGLRVNKVTSLTDDIALNLKVPSVRMVAPIPGKNTVGVEVPNEHRAEVRLKEVMAGSGRSAAKQKLPLFLGKDAEGRPLVYDLADMPHLLIAGRTGTGKSVCLNALILSLLMTRRPDETRMILIDPKRTEMIEYSKIPHLMHPVVVDMKKAEAILSWAVDKMEERYDLLSRARVRGIATYNELGPDEILRRVQPADEQERERIPERMPYVVIVIDEFSDLMMMLKREVEGHVIRLAQKSRAAGIHLILATQKPTVDVITGLIKSNLPARICFQVSSRSDSRVVLDEMGADKLLGKGDMLFLQPGTSTLIRAQGTYASDREIINVVEYVAGEPCYDEELVELEVGDKEGGGEGPRDLKSRDELYEQAIEVVVREGRGSCSLLQRALGIGYGRASRMIDFMAEDGIVGAYNGSNARDVLYTPEEWQARKRGGPLADSA
jgi:S-DNA-T family DNA segregation ATPase FtsK/SpoIIIE